MLAAQAPPERWLITLRLTSIHKICIVLLKNLTSCVEIASVSGRGLVLARRTTQAGKECTSVRMLRPYQPIWLSKLHPHTPSTPCLSSHARAMAPQSAPLTALTASSSAALASALATRCLLRRLSPSFCRCERPTQIAGHRSKSSGSPPGRK